MSYYLFISVVVGDNYIGNPAFEVRKVHICLGYSHARVFRVFIMILDNRSAFFIHSYLFSCCRGVFCNTRFNISVLIFAYSYRYDIFAEIVCNTQVFVKIKLFQVSSIQRTNYAQAFVTIVKLYIFDCNMSNIYRLSIYTYAILHLFHKVIVNIAIVFANVSSTICIWSHLCKYDSKLCIFVAFDIVVYTKVHQQLYF